MVEIVAFLYYNIFQRSVMVLLLAIDIGNTHITMGAFEDDALSFVSRIATDVRQTADQYAVTLLGILKLKKVDVKSIQCAIIGSVVPGLDSTLAAAVSETCHVSPLILGPGIKTGLNIRIDNPAQLGADLVAGAVAAVAMFPMPCIILDLGTATKISVLDHTGAFLGCTISAGPQISLDALATRTAQLPFIHLKAPRHVIGTNTIHSMQSGLLYGTAAMLDGVVERIEEEIGAKATLAATGGLSKPVIGNCRREMIHCENLILEGLKIIYHKNQVMDC